MRYRTLGTRTGLRVSEVGLGAWGIGGPVAVKNRTSPDFAPANYGDMSEAQAVATIAAAIDSGINLIDTAPFYGGDGVSERRIGQFLKGRHDDVVVVTKVGVYKEGDLYRRIYTREVVRRQVEESRQRLQRDVLDVELIHSPTRQEYGNGEALEELLAQKAAGRVKYIGFSTLFDPSQGLEWLKSGVIDVIEVPLSLVRPSMADEVLPLAEQMGVGVIAREPLGNGFLTGRFTAETEFGPTDQRRNWPREQVLDFIRRADEFRFLSEERGTTRAQSALAWVLSHSAVSTVIGGAMTDGEIRENAAVGSLDPLGTADLARARRILDRELVSR